MHMEDAGLSKLQYHITTSSSEYVPRLSILPMHILPKASIGSLAIKYSAKSLVSVGKFPCILTGNKM